MFYNNVYNFSQSAQQFTIIFQIVISFLSLQRSKQRHIHHRALCKLRKLWNAINCTGLQTKYKINFRNNQQTQTHNTAFKFKEFLTVIYQTQQKCKDRFFDRLPPGCSPTVTEVPKLKSNCTLTDQFTHEMIPLLKFRFTILGFKEQPISHPAFNDKHFSSIYDSFYSKISKLKFNKYVLILEA